MKLRIAVAVLAVATVALSAWAVQDGKRTPPRDTWTAAELDAIASMRLKQSGARPADPSNAYEHPVGAAALGRALFNDPRLSHNGQVSCASCHSSDKQFQDGKPFGDGLATGRRRTMPVMGASHSPFLFWDGRKDSLWSQALGPLEDAAEHGGNRVARCRLLKDQYQAQYQAVFGAFPAFGKLPEDASPNGNAAEREAWASLSPATAMPSTALSPTSARPSRPTSARSRTVSRVSTATRQRRWRVTGADRRCSLHRRFAGLRLFLGKGQCVTCHNGPLMTDQPSTTPAFRR